MLGGNLLLSAIRLPLIWVGTEDVFKNKSKQPPTKQYPTNTNQKTTSKKNPPKKSTTKQSRKTKAKTKTKNQQENNQSKKIFLNVLKLLFEIQTNPRKGYVNNAKSCSSSPQKPQAPTPSQLCTIILLSCG